MTVREPEGWETELVLIPRGKRPALIAPIAANVTTILRRHPAWAGIVAYDAFAERIITTRTPPWYMSDVSRRVAPGAWTDVDTDLLANWFARHGVNIGKREVEDGLRVAAESNRNHPVRDYLRELEWDGNQRIGTLVGSYFNGIDTPYTRGISRRWMISAIARVMRPGCQADHTLILESREQGLRKSSGFRALVPVPTWFSETPIAIGSKDSYAALHGCWIYCLDELDSIRRSDNTRTKSFLTSVRDRYRPPYGRHAQDFPRQNVFCGATNEEQYLSDATGNRRYWPARVERPADTDAIERDRDQLWAEALVAYRAEEPWWDDTSEFHDLCVAEQAKREMPDGWEAPFRAYLLAKDSGRGVTTTQILLGATDLGVGHLGRSEMMRAAAVLRRLGYTDVVQDSNGARRYRLPTAARELQATRYLARSCAEPKRMG